MDKPVPATLVVGLSCGAEYIDQQTVEVNQQHTVDIDFDPALGKQYILSISRFDPALYNTKKLEHDSYVTVDSIVIDNFWKIGSHNHSSQTVYHPTYVAHVGDSTAWQLSHDLYNNKLYFNGALEYQLSIPVRRMFLG